MLDYLNQRNRKPSVSTADAGLILGKVERLCKRTSRSGHSSASWLKIKSQRLHAKGYTPSGNPKGVRRHACLKASIVNILDPSLESMHPLHRNPITARTHRSRLTRLPDCNSATEM